MGSLMSKEKASHKSDSKTRVLAPKLQPTGLIRNQLRKLFFSSSENIETSNLVASLIPEDSLMVTDNSREALIHSDPIQNLVDVKVERETEPELSSAIDIVVTVKKEVEDLGVEHQDRQDDSMQLQPFIDWQPKTEPFGIKKEPIDEDRVSILKIQMFLIVK